MIAAGIGLPLTGGLLRPARADAPEIPELRCQGWANTVTLPELAEDLGYLAPLRLNWVGNTISGPQDIQATVTRDVDFGGAFHGAILKLVAAGAPIQAVIGYTGSDKESWRGLYVLEDSPIRAPRDLIGKKIAVNTLGAHNEYIIDEYLKRNGLSDREIRDVTLVVLPQSNQEQALRLKQVDGAVLETIFREKAVQRGGVRVVVSDLDLLGEFTVASYVLTKRFLQRNPNASRLFVAATARAIEWARTQQREAVIARMQEIIRKRGRNEDIEPVTYWRSIAMPGQGGVLADRFFDPFIEWYGKNGDAAIGRLHARDVYTNALNPLASGQG